MKNKLKYVICTVISIAVTFSIVAFPHFYYSVKDSAKSEDRSESLKLDKVQSRSPSISELSKLIMSGEAIWVKNTENISEKYITVLADIALQDMRKSLEESDYALWAIDLFLNEEEPQVIYYNSQIVSGVIDGAPISATIIEAEFCSPFFDTMQIMFDSKTHKIYRLSMNTYYEIMDTIFDSVDSRENIANLLSDYYETDKNGIYPTVLADPYYFCIDIFMGESDSPVAQYSESDNTF